MNAVQLIQKYEKPILIGVGGSRLHSVSSGMPISISTLPWRRIIPDGNGLMWFTAPCLCWRQKHKDSLHHSLALEVARFLALIVLAWALLKAALKSSPAIGWNGGSAT